MHKNRILIYILAFLITVLLSFSMLVLVAFLPQERIIENTKTSAWFLALEGNNVGISDKTVGTILDNNTDAIILMTSMATSNENLSYTLTNPTFAYAGPGYVEALYDYVCDIDRPPTGYYTRYWMGFRAIVRPLLSIMHYLEIRQYMAYSLLLLFSFLVASIARKIDLKTAVIFALSFILVKPHIIYENLTYSCCFFIAFIAMLMVPWISRNSKFEKLFFMEIGMLTMYFDFYTTPIVTFGLPMVYLYLLYTKRENMLSAKTIISDAVIWLTGYVGMWLAKIFLTEMLTSVNALESAIRSVLEWQGIGNATYTESYVELLYSTMTKVTAILITDSVGKALTVAGFCLIVIIMICGFHKGIISWEKIARYKNVLLVVLCPILWFAASVRPMQYHNFFQYRSVCVIFFAVGSYFCLLCSKADPIYSKKCQSKDAELT